MTELELLTAVYERQGETNAKLDQIIQHNQQQDVTLQAHSKRLRKMEHKWAVVTLLFVSFPAIVAGWFRKGA